MNRKNIDIKNVSFMRLKAFSIMELVVAMLVSSIVIGFGSGVYLIAQQYFNRFEAQYSRDSDLLMLYTVLEEDFEGAENIKESNDGMSFQSREKVAISYSFGERFIVRNKEFLADTFFIWVYDLSFTRMADMELITDVNFILSSENETIPVCLHKEYTKDVLFEFNYKNEH